MPEWLVEVGTGSVLELEESFFQGPIRPDGLRVLNEREVDRIGGLKVCVFSNEHPPHFRVSFQGETANYTIRDCAQMNGGLQRFYRNVRQWHGDNKQLLIDTWNQNRPTNCPVGLYRE